MNRKDIARAMDDGLDPWFFGNRALYTLCVDHPDHSDAREAIAKVLIIGRTYAAAIERRKKARGGSTALGDASTWTKSARP